MMKNNNKTIQKKALKIATEAAISAGKVLIKHQNKLHQLTISFKEAAGVVSNADVEAENLVIKKIKKVFPDAEFLAEESSFEKYGSRSEAYAHLQQTEWLWVIDPLDGTTNFLNGMDYFAVCISLVYRGTPVMGLVYRPRTGECFYALKGEGSFCKNLNSNSKAVSLLSKKNSKPLKSALLVTGFASEKGKVFDREFNLFKKFIAKSRGIRRMGSAALDMCFVANGVFDAFWERGLAPWDVAAAGLICLEAGVKVTDYNQNKFHPFQETILACRAPLYKEFTSQF